MTACVVCGKNEPDRGLVCDSDRNRIRHTLDDILELWAELPDALMPAAGHGPKVSGSREAPLPINVDVLDLTLPAQVGNVIDLWRDQTGLIGVATILDTWVRDWIDTRGESEHLPVPTVPELHAWLANRLDWACDRHPAVDEFAAEIGKLRGALRAALGKIDPKPEAADRACPNCNWLSLYYRPGTEWIDCTNPNCQTTISRDEYADRLRAIHKAVTRRAA